MAALCFVCMIEQKKTITFKTQNQQQLTVTTSVNLVSSAYTFNGKKKD